MEPGADSDGGGLAPVEDAWIRVRIRFSLGAMIARSSGCRVPPSLRRISCGRSAAWSRISRKFYAQSAGLGGVVR